VKVELVVLVFVIFDVVISTGGAVVDRVVDSTSVTGPTTVVVVLLARRPANANPPRTSTPAPRTIRTVSRRRVSRRACGTLPLEVAVESGVDINERLDVKVGAEAAKPAVR